MWTPIWSWHILQVYKQYVAMYFPIIHVWKYFSLHPLQIKTVYTVFTIEHDFGDLKLVLVM